MKRNRNRSNEPSFSSAAAAMGERAASRRPRVGAGESRSGSMVECRSGRVKPAISRKRHPGILARHLRKIQIVRDLGSVMKYRLHRRIFRYSGTQTFVVEETETYGRYTGSHGMTKDYMRLRSITRDDSFACRILCRLSDLSVSIRHRAVRPARAHRIRIDSF